MKRHVFSLLSAAIALAAIGGNAYAGSAADALLGAVQPTAGAQQNGATASAQNGAQPMILSSQIKLTDPFLMQFFSAWQTEKNLPYEVNGWAMKIVQQQFADAAHLWSAIQPKAPESFAPAAQAAQLYLLYKLDLPQTFIDQYLTAVRSPSFAESRALMALDQTIAQGFDHWLVDRHLVASAEQEAIIGSLPKRGMLDTTLKAWVALRKGDKALEVLEGLPADSAFKIPLGQTVALALARRNDLSGAAQVLKKHVEPGLEARKDPIALSSHNLQIARLLYQAGSLDGAETFYEKIPNGSPDFLKAREELTWVWLRKGDVGHLRGEITTLSSRLFDDQFSPEVYLVRAISNLKLCYYQEVQKDFDAFLKNNQRWATQITAALKAENPPAPSDRDYFTRIAEAAIESRQQEASRLEQLSKESITAVLPAVGPQSHWTRAHDGVLATIETLKKRRSDEYRRQWKNRQIVLSEAIRKMKFVKVELLTQIRMASRNVTDQVTTSAAAPARAMKVEAANPAPEGEMSFPFDGVIWPDEIFRLQSVAQGRCMQLVGGGSSH